jgi:hypothetical protein
MVAVKKVNPNNTTDVEKRLFLALEGTSVRG